MQLPVLQGLRGVAILLVVAFHLRPSEFALAFVGVDVFFVLSGFLVAKILRGGNENMHPVTFLVRRFKRIVPLYYITIFGVYVGCALLVLPIDRHDFVEDLKWALPLVYNVKPIFEHIGYWEQVKSFRFLAHTWSLCVELQFYLVAPAITVVAGRLPYQLRVAGFCSAAVASFIFHSVAPQEMSYGLMPARLWQFFVGWLAFEVSKQLFSKPSTLFLTATREKIGTFAGALFVSLSLYVLLFSRFGSEFQIRVLFTLCTGFLVFSSSTTSASNSLLCSRHLVKLGDISYPLYLIHWPLIVFFRYFLNVQINLPILDCVLVVLVTILLTLATHRTLEKFFIRSSCWVSLLTCAVSAGFMLGQLPAFEMFPDLPRHLLPRQFREAVEWNMADQTTNLENLPCFFDDAATELTKFTVEPQMRCISRGNSSAKILIIGNSIAYTAFPLIFELFRGRYRELRLFAKSGCPPLSSECPSYTRACHIIVENYKPDILWVIQGVNELVSPAKTSTSPKDDFSLRKIYSKNLKLYSKNAKRVLVDLPYFIVKQTVANVLARSLTYRFDVKSKLTFDAETVIKQISPQIERLKALECENCVFNDVQTELMTHGSYQPFDENNFALSHDGSHLNPRGLDRLRRLYAENIDQTLEDLNLC